jgi:hypothetical protein
MASQCMCQWLQPLACASVRLMLWRCAYAELGCYGEDCEAMSASHKKNPTITWFLAEAWPPMRQCQGVCTCREGMCLKCYAAASSLTAHGVTGQLPLSQLHVLIKAAIQTRKITRLQLS